MSTCANGHESDWDDYCSVCGDAMRGAASTSAAGAAATPDADASPDAPAAAASAAPSAGPTCANCAEPHGADDTFCESCGYDFATGSLPDAEPTAGAPAASPNAANAGGDPASPSLPPAVAIVSADAVYFGTAVEGDGADLLDFPDPVPPETRVPLTGTKVLIGRHSQSRGIYPEIDLASITEDPAVSGRHAMLHRADDGSWTISDLGSTNGTTVAGATIDPGVETSLPPGASIHLGAWSRIVLE